MTKNTEVITIKVEGNEWQTALDKSFKKNVKNKKVDGFRPGSISKEMYLERFGVESLYNDAFDMVLDDAYSKAFEQKKVEPQVQPSVNVKEINKDSLTIEFTFIGKPEIKLGEYKNLGLEKDKVEVTEEEITHEIEHLREQFAEIRVKDEGAVVEKGDTAVIDFKGTVDGEVLEGGTGENFPLEIGSNTFIPGFEDGVLGMKVKEEKDLHLKFPEDYQKDLAGKEVVFHVTVEEIKTRILPEIDEDFFKDLGYDKVTNESELHEEVKKILEEDKAKSIDEAFIDQILEVAASKMEVEIPEEIIHEEIHRMMHQWEEQLKRQNLTLKQYYEFTGTKEEDLHKEMEPEAIKRVKYRYLLEEIAKVEKIDVTEEEAEKDAEEMAQNYGISKEELIEAFGSMEILKYDARMRKTFNFLKDNN